MSNIVENSTFHEEIPLIERGEKVEGGEDGVSNRALILLADRTRFLKDLLTALSLSGLVLKGYLPDEDTLLAIPTEDLQIGTCYFVDYALRAWNGTEWATSGSLRGERGINLLGVWPDQVPLPEVEDNVVGDAYIWNNDFWVLVPNELRWEGMGIRGPEGASAYEIWKSQPGNEDKTQTQYLKSLEGKDAYAIAVKNGFVGTEVEWLDSIRAKSNYEIWLQQGNTGTETDFLATLKSTEPGPPGESIKGDPGNDGRNLAITGTLNLESDLQGIVDPKDQDAYVTLDTNHLWMFIVTDEVGAWTDLGPFKGKDGVVGSNGRNLILTGAVDTFADLPAEPTDQDIYSVRETNTIYGYIVDKWESLGQFHGKDGKDGTDGFNIVLTGAVTTTQELPGDAPDQSVYSITETNTLYAKIDGAWVLMGKFQGEKGDKGDPGDSIKGDPGEDAKYVTLKGAVETVGDLPEVGVEDQTSYAVRLENAIYTRIEGVWEKIGTFKGQDGLVGSNGTNIILKGVVETFEDLPGTPVDQDVYAVRDENAIYAFINDAWANMGVFKGADGTNGTNGENGKDGKSVEVIKILTDADPVPPVADESNRGKSYVDQDGMMWININDEWQKAGAFSVGEVGPMGPALKPRGTVATVADLPPLEEVEQGDMWFTADTKLGYVKVDDQWSDPIDMIGAEGKEGKQGTPGALMPILGLFNTMEELEAAHPTGARGDAYLIITAEGRDLVIWNIDTNSWQNTGPAGLRGEKGDTGEGIQGRPGDKGEKGSVWLTLPEGQDEPSNTFNGRPGDWAVTKNLKVWYKTLASGWVFWNDLVAGDVNSPLLSQGKVLRYGTEWVKPDVEEVVEPVAGGLYARQLKEGSEDETEWVLIAFPEFPDVPQADGKQYVRVWEVGAEEPTYKEVVFPESIADLALDDDKQYVRVFQTGSQKPEWREIQFPTGSVYDPENPEANAVYLRRPSDGTWVKTTLPPTTAGLQFVQIGGEWKSFDRYDLLIKTANATLTIDPSKEQFVKLDNSGSTAKVVSIANHGATRGMVVVLEVVGIAGAISYGGTNIKWDQNTIPSLTGTKNLILFTWDGEIWIGSKGPNLIN